MNKDVHIHLESLKLELEKLSPAIKHLQQADENTAALVAASKRVNGEYAVHLRRIEEKLLELNTEHHNSIESEINAGVKRIDDATYSINESYDYFKKLVTSLTAKYKSIADETAQLIVKIDKIDFPTRLDSLYSAVSSIHQALQNTHQRIGDQERNLKDDLKAKSLQITGQLEDTNESLTTQIAAVQKENKVLKLLLIGSIALSMATIILVFIKF